MAPNEHKSLWLQYVEELMDRRGIEYDWGFVHYSYPAWAQDCIMIDDLFVAPEHRKSGKGKILFDGVSEIGRLAGKKWLIAHLELGTRKYVDSWAAQLAVGLLPISAEQGKILVRKQL